MFIDIIDNMDPESIQKRIDKNRDEIEYWLNGNFPLDIVYMRINILSSQNKKLVKILNNVNNE